MAICGKFKGQVINNTDPEQRGRLEVQVPDVQGGVSGWALPCLPYAGANVGFFAPPPVGSNVWVEFEGGDVESPIWTGCFWNPGEAPPAAARPEQKIFVTPGVSLSLDDTLGSGTLTLEIPAHDATIKLDASGVRLVHQSATINITGPTVSINQDALEVT